MTIVNSPLIRWGTRWALLIPDVELLPSFEPHHAGPVVAQRPKPGSPLGSASCVTAINSAGTRSSQSARITGALTSVSNSIRRHTRTNRRREYRYEAWWCAANGLSRCRVIARSAA